MNTSPNHPTPPAPSGAHAPTLIQDPHFPCLITNQDGSRSFADTEECDGIIEDRVARAALIVRAVNSFDAMRTALEAMLAWESPDGTDRDSTPYLKQARAALALATPPERE